MGFVFNLIYKKIGLLFCLCSVVPTIGVSPQYSYECNENGDIIILGLSQHSEIKITDVFGDNGTVAVQKCDIKADRFGHALINSNCTDLPIKSKLIIKFKVLNSLSATSTLSTIINSSLSPTTIGTSNINNTSKVTLPTLSHDLKSSSPSSNSSSTTSQINSQSLTTNTPTKKTDNGFKIICKKFRNGYIQNVINLSEMANIVPMEPVFNSVGRVEMRFKSEKPETEEDLKYLPDISTVYVGDKFYMLLKYMGQQDYKIVPQKCFAFDGGVAVKNQGDPKVLLWSYNNCVSNDASKYHLMHNFEKISSNKILLAEMFGFHFVDDADISVVCDVMICSEMNNSEKCKLKKTDCPVESKWKVKRSLDKNDVMVTGRLKVRNRRQQYSSNTAGEKQQNLWSILLIFAIVNMTKV